MTSSPRPWSVTITARLMRAQDVHTSEVIDFAHGEFSRRTVGPGGPLASPSVVLDPAARLALQDELQAELADPPLDVDRDALTTFATLLEGSLALSNAS